MCKSRTTPRDWFKCTRPEHPAHGGVMLCTVQCRPASACARNSPPRGCTLKKQDKTRQDDKTLPFAPFANKTHAPRHTQRTFLTVLTYPLAMHLPLITTGARVLCSRHHHRDPTEASTSFHFSLLSPIRLSQASAASLQQDHLAVALFPAALSASVLQGAPFNWWCRLSQSSQASLPLPCLVTLFASKG